MATSSVTTLFRNRTIMLSITVFVGAAILFQSYFPTPQGKIVFDNLTASTATVTAFLGIAGTYQVFKIHVPEIIRREKGAAWFYSAVIVGSALTVVILSLTLGQTDPLVDRVFYRGFQTGFSKATTAMQAWTLIYAILRYTSFKNRDLAAFSAAMVVVIFTQTPLLVAVFPQALQVSTWMRLNIAGPANIAVKTGVAFAMVLVAVRVLMGRETAFLGRLGE